MVLDSGSPRHPAFDLPVHAACVPSIAPLEQMPAPHLRTEWVLLTSGTTGVPKMVVHDLSALTAAIAAKSAADGAAVWGTFYDIRRYGGLQIFLRAVLSGASLVLSSAGEPVTDHLARLAHRGVTHLSGTPSHWRRALMRPAIRSIAPRYVRLSARSPTSRSSTPCAQCFRMRASATPMLRPKRASLSTSMTASPAFPPPSSALRATASR